MGEKRGHVTDGNTMLPRVFRTCGTGESESRTNERNHNG